MESLDVVSYLAGKGYHGKRTGTREELEFPCFFDCGEPADSRKRKLYINSRTGYYHCKVCEAFGGTTLLLRHFGDEPKEVPLDSVVKRYDILEHATSITQQMLLNNEEMLLYLFGRGLSEETILERRLGYIGNNWGIAEDARTLAQASRDDLLSTGIVYQDGPRAGRDFYYNHLMIPYLERGKVAQLRGRAMGGQASGRYMTGPGENVRLYGADDLACDEVVVTEGEFDAMILAQHLRAAPDENARRIGVVGLAGVGAYPDGLEGMLTQRKVYIGFDTDDSGRRGAVKLKDLLGARARIVELPDPNEGEKKNDWTHFFAEQGATWQDAYALFGAASGRRLFTVSEAAASWAKGKASGEGVETGFRQLDAVIEPGIVPGQLVIILAKTGTGKTIFLVNLAYNMRKQHVLFISLEQTKEEVYERLRRVYLFHNPLATEAQVESAYRRVMICDQNRLTEDDFEELIEEYEAEQGVKPDVVFVDYLGYYARGRKGGTPYEKVSDAVMQLKAEAKKHRTRVIAPHQVNRGVKEGQPIDLDDARDSGVIEETADFLGSIWRTDEGTQEVLKQPSGKLRFTLLKSRHGGRGLNFNLQMDLLTLAIVDDNTAQAKVAAEHCYLHWRGVTYDELRQKQTEPKQGALV